MRTRTLVTVVVLSGAAVCAGFALRSTGDPARRQWKEQAVADIARDWNDTGRRDRQIAEIRAKARSGSTEMALFGRWFTTDLILMKDGQWIATRNYCRKETRRGGPPIDDIFIGRASDGKWYYSTYHFCVDFASLGMDSQPADLAEFVATYHLKEFDGRSNEALKTTWPP